MSNVKIKHLDIDDNFYIENDIVRVKNNNSDATMDLECSIENIWNNVEKIIMKAKKYCVSNNKV